MTGRGVIAAGNWIVDIVHDIEGYPNKNDLTRITGEVRGIGGGAANVVTALARFDTGLPLFPVGAIGDDDHGEFVLEHCRAHGLPVDRITRRAATPTGHTHVMSVPGESRTFFYQGGANDMFDGSDVPDELLTGSGARIFYLGYLLLLGALDRIASGGGTPAREILARARQAGLVTCVDLVSTDGPEFTDIVGAALPEIDYLIVNEVEAARASGVDTADAEGKPVQAGFEKAAQALLDKGVRGGVVIHCPTLTLWLERDASPVWAEPVPLPPERIVSTVGAGDAFCAGILYALHEGWESERALMLANRAASASLAGRTATDAIPPLSDLMV